MRFSISWGADGLVHPLRNDLTCTEPDSTHIALPGALREKLGSGPKRPLPNCYATAAENGVASVPLALLAVLTDQTAVAIS